MRSRALIVFAALSGALVSGGWLLQRGFDRDDSVYTRARMFDAVMGHIARDYVDSLETPELYRHAVDGLLEELRDPYTVYLAPDRLRRLSESTTGTYGGIGIQIDVRDGWIVVVTPLPGTPAEKAGIQFGDRVIAIDGKSTRGWTQEEASKALRGKKGSRLTLTIERPGVTEQLPFVLQRDDIHVRVVRHPLLLTDKVGYLDVNLFSESTAAELRTEIGRLRNRGMKMLILDMRTNPGGLLEQGVEVSDIFLDRGQKIVTMQGRARGTTREFVDETAQLWPDMPIIALVNGSSASATEIVAGALQDHDRAVIVGSTTYGKGSAQSVLRLSDGGALKLTTARWFTPSGRSIARPSFDDSDDGADGAPPPEGEQPLSEREKFRTDAGRTVYGGGGITPDLIVGAPDSVPAELAFSRALGRDIPRFRDALTDYALSVKASRTVTSPDFVVTPEMREELWQRVTRRGIDVPRIFYDSAQSLITRLIGYEVARYVFGPEAEFQRQVKNDRVIATALSLAARANTQKELLARAAEQRAAKREDVPSSP
ncbi:MAG TPA: S41 family peptidase [Gemmatimonadaceae bacterium]|nr:S41 family peptidase [Gemmatimonadaceae bacterium]